MRACGNRVPAIRTPLRLSADWLYTGEGELIPFGALLTDSLGRLVAVGPDQAVPASPLIPSRHFSRAVLLPGMVNAHTHLELTGLEGMAREADFAEWIRNIIRLKAERGPTEVRIASRAGLAGAFAAGVTTVADTGDSGAPFEALLELGGSGIVYLEVFGPDPRVADAQFDAFRARVLALRAKETDRVRLGVSPHAPYSVSGPLYARVARFAAEEGLPLAVHIAESAAESELLASAEGPFARMWQGREIPLPSLPGRSPIAWLDQHGVLTPDTLCIHAVRAGRDDINRMASRQCAVAHCPRSNRHHGHGDAPLAEFLAAGLRVGVGSDSAASVYPVDLLAEARVAGELAGLPPADALDLVLLGAARALRMEGDVGSLRAEKWADVAAVRMPDGIGPEGIAGAILGSGPRDVLATYVGGREVYRPA